MIIFYTDRYSAVYMEKNRTKQTVCTGFLLIFAAVFEINTIFLLCHKEFLFTNKIDTIRTRTPLT